VKLGETRTNKNQEQLGTLIVRLYLFACVWPHTPNNEKGVVDMSLMSTGLADEERRTTTSKSPKHSAPIRPVTITVQTACAMSGLSPSKIWMFIRDGLLPVTRFGTRTLLHFDPFEAPLLKGNGEKRKTPNRWADDSPPEAA
jgi:hypothetical protein